MGLIPGVFVVPCNSWESGLLQPFEDNSFVGHFGGTAALAALSPGGRQISGTAGG